MRAMIFALSTLLSTSAMHSAFAEGLQSPIELAKIFGQRETFYGARLSPNGDYVLFRTPSGPRETSVKTLEIATGKIANILNSSGTDLYIYNCFWAKVDRIICKVGGESSIGATKLSFSRLVSIGRDGSDPKVLGARSTDRTVGVIQYSGDVINTLPDDAASVLMDVPILAESTIGRLGTKEDSGLSVQAVDVYTGKSRIVEKASRDAAYHMTDGHGRVILRGVHQLDLNSRLLDTARFFVRIDASGQWQNFAVRDVTQSYGFEPQAIDENGEYIYYLKPLNGRQAMYRIALSGGNKEELVYSNDNVDVDGLISFGRYAKPVGVTYSDEYNHIEYFDSTVKSLSSSLSKALPGQDVTIVQDSWDGDTVLLFASADSNPGAYYLFKRSAKKLQMISPIRPEVSGLQLAQTEPISVKAADGTEIPGYLTLPPGRSKTGLPLVVMPHGGPTSRDYWGFDWLAQYLALSGYAVIQPNFRGSSGFGSNWLGENAIKNWRQAINDIDDSARWAIKEGIADSHRVAIVGWSYGGYAALQANVVDPKLYKAAVAIAPVTDWQEMKETAERYTSANVVKAQIGTGPHVREGSPAKNAMAIEAPVLLFHGTKDLNVDVKQSRMMNDALKSAGKSVEYVEYDGLNHGLIDSGARTDMLTKIGNFLAENVR